MSATIHVVNPNSLESVTRAMDEALEPLRLAQGPRIECHTLADGPPGIQSQQDVETAIPPLMRKVASLDANAGAFVIACFSDPGLHVLREITKKPVIGISEAGVLTAMTIALTGDGQPSAAPVKTGSTRHCGPWGYSYSATDAGCICAPAPGARGAT